MLLESSKEFFTSVVPVIYTRLLSDTRVHRKGETALLVGSVRVRYLQCRRTWYARNECERTHIN